MIGHHRRVVTGLNAEGRSCVLIDGPIPANSPHTGFAWRVPALPADNSGGEDIPRQDFGFDLLHDGGANFMVAEYPPGPPQTYWHATDTIDYLVVLRGEIALQLEAGEVRVAAGGFIVDRGVVHSWYNPGTETAAMAIVTLPAHPVGRGKTV
jgi:quercetin dioxygenase-like cupin family protein